VEVRKEDRKNKSLDIFIIDVTDEYQTHNFWNMKKSELRQIIKEEISKVLKNTTSEAKINTANATRFTKNFIPIIAKLMNKYKGGDAKKDFLKFGDELRDELWNTFQGKYFEDEGDVVTRPFTGKQNAGLAIGLTGKFGAIDNISVDPETDDDDKSKYLVVGGPNNMWVYRTWE